MLYVSPGSCDQPGPVRVEMTNVLQINVASLSKCAIDSCSWWETFEKDALDTCMCSLMYKEQTQIDLQAVVLYLLNLCRTLE